MEVLDDPGTSQKIVEPSKEEDGEEYEVEILGHTFDVGNLLVSPKFADFQLMPQEQNELSAFIFDLICPFSYEPLYDLI